MTSEMIRDLLASTDYLIVNEHEALDAAAGIGLSMFDFRAAADKLAKAGDLTCVVTAGAEGAVAATADDSHLQAPSLNIRPVDTTGAGDAFVGAFACALDEKATLQKSLEVGCEAASLKCLRAGAQNGMPMRGALRSIT